MIRTPSILTTSLSALVAALFCFGVGNGFGPDAAWAQAARDLRCNQCVNRRDIRKGAVKFNRLQPKVQKRIEALEGAAKQQVPFHIALDGDGAEGTIATNGVLEIYARCRVDDGGFDRVQIIGTSSIAGWLAGGGKTDPVPRDAFDEVALLDFGVVPPNSFYSTTGFITVVALDGSFIAIDTGALGVEILGHDCVAIGTATVANGTF